MKKPLTITDFTMTPKQAERIRNKIKRIKLALAEDKRRWGGFYDDSRGLRYLPPELYLQLQDYQGALRYFRWFDKNFPTDCGSSFFHFEWAITLIKTRHHKEAEKKIVDSFMSNTYIINAFLGRELVEYGITENAEWNRQNVLDNFQYSAKMEELTDFTAWLTGFLESKNFQKYTNEFIEIEKMLETEPLGPKRSRLVDRKFSLLDDYPL